jgi:hypothetical protein
MNMENTAILAIDSIFPDETITAITAIIVEIITAAQGVLHLHLAGKHDLKPTYDELKEWLHGGQLDVLRLSK